VITETTITDEVEEVETEAQGFHLLVMTPASFGSQPLPGSGSVNIGRSSKCAVQIDDPMASREHAILHISSQGGATALSIEDVGSANGTRVRDMIIRPGERVPIALGEGTIIGSTVIMVLQNRSAAGVGRLLAHSDFESRVENECARAAISKSSFALARVRFSSAAHWMRVLPLLVRELPPPHVVAGYGPNDYEILIVEVGEGEPERMVKHLLTSCKDAGLEARSGVAIYPRDGRTADALLAAASTALKAGVPPQQPAVVRTPDGATMQRVREMAARVASSPINVLILGECGVGKDVLAQLVHKLSPRAGRPFVALNCAGLTETLLDSELFGHEKGAFTGAVSSKMGLLESASGGTVFLDEIGDMPPSMQAKLLRVIENREVRPVAGLKARPIDVRFIAATNKDLEAAVRRGDFRSDLMYRMNGITLAIPPLRDRIEEIRPLAETFADSAWSETGRPGAVMISSEAMVRLKSYRWPGNIRELKNMMERAVALSDGPEILLEHLPLEKMGPVTDETRVTLTPEGFRAAAARANEYGSRLPTLTDPVKLKERQRIVDALAACNGNQTRAAERLGMPRRTFVSKLDQYEIPRPQKNAPGRATLDDDPFDQGDPN
jgi:DNA-binding NtrC family response regulator